MEYKAVKQAGITVSSTIGSGGDCGNLKTTYTHKWGQPLFSTRQLLPCRNVG